MNWVNAVKEDTEGEIIAIDGKTAKGSRNRKNNQKPLHMVSAWACRNRLVLAQEATHEKSNEITAIPKLLDILDLKGCIVTIDAMGCQKSIASQIIEQEADYVLGLKGNQGRLHEAVEEFFTIARTENFKSVKYDFMEEMDKDHGRLEIRRYWITDNLTSLSVVSEWKGLQSIGMVERECWQEDKKTIENAFLLIPLRQMLKSFHKPYVDIGGLKTYCIGDWMLFLEMTQVIFEKTMVRQLW